MKKEEQEEILKEATKKYGFDSQLDQLTEECAELIVACNKLRRNGHNDPSITMLIDELADVKIMCRQITKYLRLESLVEDRVIFKMERLKKRLEK